MSRISNRRRVIICAAVLTAALTAGLLASVFTLTWLGSHTRGAPEARAAAPTWVQQTRTRPQPLIPLTAPNGTPLAPATLFAPATPLAPTPFLPVAPTPTASPTPRPSPTPIREPYLWYGLNLRDGAQTITLRMDASAQTITLAFRPGTPCEYQDHRACVSAHFGGRLLLATVHSGVGGEGQALRHAIEGTGLNRAGFSLERIDENLSALRGAPVSADAGSRRVDDLRVLAAVRVPADGLAQYFAQPVEDAFAALAQDSPALKAALKRGQPLLAIETCGWRHPAEPWAEGVSDTTGSVYILVIGK